jgi:hypothetical protein
MNSVQEMNNSMSYIYTATIIAGCIIVLLTARDKTYNSLSGTIVGYVLIMIGFLLMMTMIITSIYKSPQQLNVLSVMFHIGPFFIILSLLSVVVWLLSTHFDQIVENRVSPGYNTFTNIIIVITAFQLMVFFYGMRQPLFKSSNKLPKLYTLLIYFLGIISCVAVLSLSNVLSYFSTDG